MAHPEKGEFAINLAGKPYVLLASFDAVQYIEDQAKPEGVFDFIERITVKGMQTRDVEIAVAAGMKAAGAMPPENLRELVYRQMVSGVDAAVKAQLYIPLVEFLAYIYRGGPNPEKEEKSTGEAAAA
jgi:hypothetical protein